MQRPPSQHFFALAAEVERIQMTLRGLTDYDRTRMQPSFADGVAAEDGLMLAVKALLAAGNKLKEASS